MSKKLDLLTIFLRDYHSSYSGREVARLIDVSPQTALSVLDSLVKLNILLIKKEGRNNKYSLNLTDLRTKMMLVLAENNAVLNSLLKKELKSIIDKLLVLAETIIVFGSFAKGLEKKSSDLDLVVIGVKDKDKFRKVKRIFPREINVEFITWNNFVKTQNTALGIEIKKDHLIYGNVFKVVKVFSKKWLISLIQLFQPWTIGQVGNPLVGPAEPLSTDSATPEDVVASIVPDAATEPAVSAETWFEDDKKDVDIDVGVFGKDICKIKTFGEDDFANILLSIFYKNLNSR